MGQNKQYIFILGISFFLVLLIGWVFDFRHTINQISSEKSYAEALYVKTKVNQELLAENKETRQKFNLLASQTQQSDVLGVSLTSALFHLFSLARLNGIAVRLIKPSESKLFWGKKVRVIEFSMVGTLPKMSILLSEFQRSHLPLLPMSFSLYHHIDGTWRMAVYLISFARETFSGDLRRQDFSVDAHFSPEKLLISLPLNEMRYTGFIETEHVKWALIKLPNDKTLPVQVGSVLGSDKAVVIAIQEHKVIVNQRKNANDQRQSYSHANHLISLTR